MVAFFIIVNFNFKKFTTFNFLIIVSNKIITIIILVVFIIMTYFEIIVRAIALIKDILNFIWFIKIFLFKFINITLFYFIKLWLINFIYYHFV